MLFRRKPNSLSVEMELSEQTMQHLAVLLFFHFTSNILITLIIFVVLSICINELNPNTTVSLPSNQRY